MSSSGQPPSSGISSRDMEELLTELAHERGMVRDETGKAMNLKEIYEACQLQISALKERVDQLEQTNLIPADNVSVPRADHVPPGALGGDSPSHGGGRSREQGATVSRERSRTPAPKSHKVCWSNWVDDLYDDDGVGELLDRVPEEDVGNLLDLSDGDLGQRGVGSFEVASVKTGCFANSVETEGAWEPLPETSGPLKFDDHESYFCHAMESQSKVFEISMDLQARDVHQVKQGSKTQWVPKEKPKKRAEVQFRSLTEADKMEFLGAMKNELSSYLEHEAVAIASRHNVPRERILGCDGCCPGKRSLTKLLEASLVISQTPA